MKYLYPLSLLLFLVSCQKEEKKVIDRAKTDWAFYKLEGNVKTISEKNFAINSKFEKIKSQNENPSGHDSDIEFSEDGMQITEKLWLNGTTPFQETTFNGKEKVVKKIQYINGKPGIITEHAWDKSGNNSSITRRNPDNTQIDRIEMKYNGNKVAEKIKYNTQNNPIDKVAYIYDKKGNLLREHIYLGSEYIQYKALYKYDDKNRITREARYNKDSKIDYQTEYVYEGNNLMKKETTNGDGKVEYLEKYTYDKKGNMLSHYIFENFDKSVTMNKFEYDAKGNRTGWSIDVNDAPKMKAIYTYDDKNSLISLEATEASGKPVDKRSFAFEYDSKGNWTKKTISIKGQPQFLVERQLTYYDEE